MRIIKMNLQITDNSKKDIVNDTDFKKLDEIGNKNISDLIKSNPHLLVFPQNLGLYGDEIGKQKIFELSSGKVLTTGNIMGFIGKDNTQLTIKSRFDKGENNYFLHYMLQKVMSINILDLPTKGGNKDDFYDFLLYFFPLYLGKALKQGLYKEYHRNEYNDSNMRGVIDVKRHIKLNIPFIGKVAYTMREYVYDNPVMQLIRHTIEYMKTHPLGKLILNNKSDICENVNTIIFHTQNYNKNNRQKIINFNIKKTVNHPYFSEYRSLQKICIRILQKDKITFNEQNDKIKGLLFDGAWLWEEYIATILKENDIEHRTRRIDKLFKDRNIHIKPDFIRSKEKIKDETETASFIGDTKYKHKDESSNNNADYYQIMTYMFRYSCKIGYLIFPYDKTNEKKSFKEELEIKNKSGYKVIKFGMKIPQDEKSEKFFENFCNNIKDSEQELKREISNYIRDMAKEF